MLNNPITSINPSPQFMPNGTLQSDTDSLTSIVGFNPNQYVFGDTPLSNSSSSNQTPNQNNSNVKVAKPNKTSSALVGGLLLGGLSLLGVTCFKAAKGKKFEFSGIKKFFSNFKNATKAFSAEIKK